MEITQTNINDCMEMEMEITHPSSKHQNKSASDILNHSLPH